MNGLQNVLPGSTDYLATKAAALLVPIGSDSAPAPAGSSGSKQPLALAPAGPGSPAEDLGSFLLPRLLRAAASLEAALLQSATPQREVANSIADAATGQVWRDRRKLRDSLETMLVKSVTVLVESAVRLEWSRKGQVVGGGIGRAREMVEEMLRLVTGKH